MARSAGLREFQENLARRLANAAAHETLRSRLAIESGDLLWLLPLPDAGEVMPVPRLCRVPLTRRWYNGLVNVRGTLHGMVDLADFCGYGVTPRNSESALLLCGQRHGMPACWCAAWSGCAMHRISASWPARVPTSRGYPASSLIMRAANTGKSVWQIWFGTPRSWI